MSRRGKKHRGVGLEHLPPAGGGLDPVGVNWTHDVMPRVLPPDWVLIEVVEDGARWRHRTGMVVLASASQELDGRRWLHVSCSRPRRLPNWSEFKEVKDIFIGRHKKAIQILPTQKEYVNIHPNVLHLFHCLDEDPLPDFTRGSGSL